jgi:hypothetical protein
VGAGRRTSMPAARDASPTVINEAPASINLADTGGGAPVSRRTANVAKLQTSEIANRWQGALSELEASIERARRRSIPPGRSAGSGPRERFDRASGLAASAKEQLAGVERAARMAAEQQSKVDRIEVKGREFRATFGHALDELVRQRTRERVHAAALGARHDVLREGTKNQEEASIADALVWETAALGAEAERARLQEDDLTLQIDTLQAQLDNANLNLEMELAEASGALEGSLAALRQLTGEFVRTLDEAAAEVSGSSSASR